MDEIVKMFISSRQLELEKERAWASEAVRETGLDLGERLEPILVEHKPAPPSTTIQDQCHEELKGCKAIICIYYKTISDIVKDEFRWANERGVPTFLFKKEPHGKDEAIDELKNFIEKEVGPPSGGPEGPYGIYVYKPFHGEDIKDKIKASLKGYRKKGFNFKPIPERYLPSKAWPGKLEKIKEAYVKPRCYPAAEKKLKNNRLLIITGPAHLGKTSMAFHLADSLQKAFSRRFLIFPSESEEGLSELADLHDSVILLDDPFGGIRYAPGTIGDKFDRLQELACKNYIVITSRREVLDEACKYTKLGEKNLKDLTIEIMQGDYSDEDFEAILEKHLKYSRASSDIITLANSHKEEIINELRFPHNYEVLVREELGNVIKGEKDLQQALKDAKGIERAVGRWFENWYSKDKEVFYFLLVLALNGRLEEKDFIRIYKNVVERLNSDSGLGLSPSGDLARKRKETAPYVSQSGPLRLEHPSYEEGIITNIMQLFRDDGKAVLEDMAGDEDPNVRSCAAWKLRGFGRAYPQEALPILNRLIKDEAPQVCYNARWALVALEKTSPTDVTFPNFRALEEAHPKMVIEVLERMARDKDPRLRYVASCTIERIAKQHPDEAMNLLLELAKSGDPWVRFGIASAMINVGEHHPGEVLPTLKELALDKDPLVRFPAAEALGVVGATGEKYSCEVLPVLERLAEDEDGQVRYGAATGLGLVRQKYPAKVVPVMERLSRNKNPEVSSWAKSVLAKMGRQYPT